MSELNHNKSLPFRQSIDGWGNFLLLSSENLADAIIFIKQNEYIYLEISKYNGFNDNNLDFLSGFEHKVLGLALLDKEFDTKGVARLINLKYLQCAAFLKEASSFMYLGKLKFLSFSWYKEYKEYIFNVRLSHISIWNYNRQFGFNSQSLKAISDVIEMKIVSSNIENLNIINSSNQLNKLEIIDCRKLLCISNLINCTFTMKYLHIESCKNIKDIYIIGKLNNINYLNLYKCGTIKSISFIKNMHLNHFVFYGTTVEDGNLSYLHGIKQVGFDNKRHYTSREEEFD